MDYFIVVKKYKIHGGKFSLSDSKFYVCGSSYKYPHIDKYLNIFQHYLFTIYSRNSFSNTRITEWVFMYVWSYNVGLSPCNEFAYIAVMQKIKNILRLTSIFTLLMFCNINLLSFDKIRDQKNLGWNAAAVVASCQKIYIFNLIMHVNLEFFLCKSVF